MTSTTSALPKHRTMSTIQYLDIVEGSLEVKLPTIWTNGKAEVGRVREDMRREQNRREYKRTETDKKEKQRRKKKEQTTKNKEERTKNKEKK